MKKISNNKLYYIRDSYIVEYEGADKKVRPYFCFSHSKNFALIFPITSQEGGSSKKYRRLQIPKNAWEGNKKSYIRIHNPKLVSRKIPYDNYFKVSRDFSDFVRQSIINDSISIIKIKKLKKRIINKEKILSNVYENIL